MAIFKWCVLMHEYGKLISGIDYFINILTRNANILLQFFRDRMPYINIFIHIYIQDAFLNYYFSISKKCFFRVLMCLVKNMYPTHP